MFLGFQRRIKLRVYNATVIYDTSLRRSISRRPSPTASMASCPALSGPSRECTDSNLRPIRTSAEHPPHYSSVTSCNKVYQISHLPVPPREEPSSLGNAQFPYRDHHQRNEFCRKKVLPLSSEINGCLQKI